jgi:hypothetical protein
MGAFDDIPSLKRGGSFDDIPDTESKKAPSVLDLAKSFTSGLVTDTARGIGYPLEAAGVDYGRRMREAADTTDADIQESMTPGGRRANQTQIFSGDGVSDLGLNKGWGGAALMQTARSVPQMAMMALPGGAASKGIETALGGEKALEAAPGVSGMIKRWLPSAIGYGGAEGVQAGVTNAAQTQSQIEAIPIPDLVAKSPRFAELLRQQDPSLPIEARADVARRKLAAEAAGDVFKETTLSTGGIGALTGGGALGFVERHAGKSLGGKVLGGALTEAAQETPQSAGEQYIQNLATKNYADPSTDVWSQVAQQGLGGGFVGGLTGGVTGGAGHIIHPPAPAAATPDDTISRTLDTLTAQSGEPLALPKPVIAGAASTAPDYDAARASEEAVTRVNKLWEERDAEEARRSTAMAATPEDLLNSEIENAKTGIKGTAIKAGSSLAAQVDSLKERWDALGLPQEEWDRVWAPPAKDTGLPIADIGKIMGDVTARPGIVGTVEKVAAEQPGAKAAAAAPIEVAPEAELRALTLLQAGKVDELTQADRDYVATHGYVKLQNGQPQILPRGTRRLRALEKAQPVDALAHGAATSPNNALPEPTQAQKEAGNYRKGHIAKIDGLNVSIENPALSVRSSKPGAPAAWKQRMKDHYGYVKGVPARAPDKEHVDVFVKQKTHTAFNGDVYVVDQNNEAGDFDEPKVMVGYANEEEAKSAYLRNYSPGWDRIRQITKLSMPHFKERLQDPKAFLQPQPQGATNGDQQNEHAQPQQAVTQRAEKTDNAQPDKTGVREPAEHRAGETQAGDAKAGAKGSVDQREPTETLTRAHVDTQINVGAQPDASVITKGRLPIALERTDKAYSASPKQLGIIARAVRDIVQAVPMFSRARSLVTAYGLHPAQYLGPYASGTMAKFFTGSKVITIRDDLVEKLGAEKEGSQKLRGWLAHEMTHALDLDAGSDGNFASESSPLLSVEIEHGKNVPTGQIFKEIFDVWVDDPDGIGEFFDYPLSQWDTAGAAWLKFETFAQAGRLFATNPELLRKYVPTAHQLFVDINETGNRLAGSPATAERIRAALRGSSDVGDTAAASGAREDVAQGVGNSRANTGGTERREAGVSRQPDDIADNDARAGSKAAFFGDDSHIQFIPAKGRQPVKIFGIYSSAKGDGRSMVSWLRSETKGRLVAIEVAPTGEAHGFWEAMQEEGLIDGWTPIDESASVEEPAPRKTGTGKIVGAPPGKGSEADRSALVRKLLALVEHPLAIAEKSYKWYEDSGAEVRKLAHGDNALAEKAVRLMALYSQGNSVGGNTTAVVKSMFQIANGEKIEAGRYPSMTEPWARALLAADEPSLGTPGVNDKILNFYRNLHDATFQTTKYSNASTLDRWMMRMMGYPHNADADEGGASALSSTQYTYARDILRRVADAYGQKTGHPMLPRQVQAVLWTYVKNKAMKGKWAAAVKGWREELRSLRKLKDDDKSIVSRMRDLKRLIERPFRPETKNFAEYFQRATAAVTWETVSYNTMPGMRKATPEERAEYNRAARSVILDGNGNDELLKKLSLTPLYSAQESEGSFEGDINPNVITGVVLEGASAKGFDTKVADIYAAALGYLYSRDGVGWHRADSTLSAGKSVMGVSVTWAQPTDSAFSKRMYDHVRSEVPFDYTKIGDSEYRFLNFSGLPDGQFRAKLLSALRSFDTQNTADFTDFRAEAGYITGGKDGEDYRQKISEAGPSDLLGWLDGRRATLDAVNAHFAGKYGWATERAAGVEERGRAGQVGTPEFKGWFKQSVITDTKQPGGKPERWYHGTAQPGIEKFKAKQVGAIFASPDVRTAENFSELSTIYMGNNRMKGGAETIYPVYIRAENPFDYENEDHVNRFEAWLQNNYTDEDIAMESEVPVSDEESAGRQVHDTIEQLVEHLATGGWPAIEHRLTQKYIRGQGFDSFFVKELNTKNIGVYSPNQFKSAVGNVGTFSTEDDRILASKGGVAGSGMDAVAARTALTKEFGPGIAAAEKAGTLVIADKFEDLPESARVGMNGDEHGVYGDGKAYIVAGNITNPERIRRTLLHELGEHAGMKDWAGDQYSSILARVMDLGESGDKRIGEIWTAVVHTYPEEPPGSKRFLQEVLAKLGETAKTAGPWRAAIARAKLFLSRIGLRDLTEQDLSDFVAASLRAALNPKTAVAGAAAPALASGPTPGINSPEFRKWFKNSKVVDTDGGPLVAYHGTNVDFSEFDVGGNNEIGSWFTATPTDDHYGDTSDARLAAEGFAYTQTDLYGGHEIVVPVYLSIKNPKELNGYNAFTKLTRGSADGGKLRERLRREGYDGIVIRNSDTDSGESRDDWVVFEPTQIKSAIGNRGTFDPADPNILKSANAFGQIVRRAIQDRLKFDRVNSQSSLDAHDKRFAEVVEIVRQNLADARTIPIPIPAAPMPHVLHMLGAPMQWLSVPSNVIEKIMVKHADDFANTDVSPADLMQMIRDPVAVLKAKDGSYEVVTDMPGVSGPIMVVIKPDAQIGRGELKLKSGVVETAYGRSIDKLLQRGSKIVYFNEVKAQSLDGVGVAKSTRKFVEGGLSNGSIKDRYALSKFISEQYKGPADDAPMASRPDWINQQQPAMQEALRKVGTWHEPPTLRERVAAWAPEWKKRVTQGLLDQFDPIKNYDYHAYMLARMAKSGDAALEGLLKYGTVHMDKDGALDVKFEEGGFLGVLSKLQNEHDRFFAWVAAQRAEKLLAEGREHNLTPAQIRLLKTLNQGAMPDGAARPALYAKTLTDLQRYNNAVLDVAEKAGLIDGASRPIWQSEFYVPFYRLMEESDKVIPAMGKGLVRQYAFKKLKGGSQELGDLVENVMKNWSHLLNASLRNNAARESLTAAAKIGAAMEGPEETLRQMAKSAGQKDAVVNVVDGGVSRWFYIEDPFLLDAVNSIGFSGFSGPAMKIMSKFKRWLTMGVTISPTFRLRNIIRDSLQAIGTTQTSYNVLSNVLTGWKGTKEGSPDYASIIAGGGVMRYGTLLEGDRAEHVKRLIESGVDRSTILTTPERVQAMLTQAWDWWQHTGDRAENVNRVALYKKLRAEGKSHLEAAFAARDMMDFSMQGTWASVRFLAQTVPFFNARVQGLYKIGRGAVEDPRRFAAIMGAATLASLALMLAYKDDDDWKQREDWDRETFWWFKVGDKAFRIPKPFEIGAIATVAERGLEAMINPEFGGKDFADRVFNILWSQLSLNPTPQFFAPMLEVWANKDTFTDRPIESQGMEKLSPSERIGANTSAAAQLLGKNNVISPVQIDHLINGYFGWLGVHIAASADLALRPAMGMPGKPEARVDELFAVGDFVKDMPSYQSRYVTRLYDQGQKFQQVLADLKHYQQIGALDKAQEILTNEGDKLALAKLYTHADQQMTKINAAIKQTQIRELDPAEKRERLTMLNDLKNKLAKMVDQRAREVEAAR